MWIANARYAESLRVNPSDRCTCVKPSGTASLALGGIASGIHPHHARRYFRRITANPMEPVAKWFESQNPHMVEVKPNGDWCLTFPVCAPDGAITLKDLTAMEFLQNVLIVQKHWVEGGRVFGSLKHNVSCTVVYKPEEFTDIIKFVWHHKDDFAALTFLPEMSDKQFDYMPREEVCEQDESKWQRLCKEYTPVDYSQMIEEDDKTNPSQEIACSGDSCEVINLDIHYGEGLGMVFDDNGYHLEKWNVDVNSSS